MGATSVLCLHTHVRNNFLCLETGKVRLRLHGLPGLAVAHGAHLAHAPSRDRRHMRLTSGSPAVHALTSHRPPFWQALHRPEFKSTYVPGCGFTSILHLAPWRRLEMADGCLDGAVAASVSGLDSVSSWTRPRLPLAQPGLMRAPRPRTSQVWV